MNPEEAVDQATEVIEALADTGEQELREMLLQRGIQPFLADQLAVLVPLAFSRAYFETTSAGKQYWDYFLLVDRRTGKEEKHRLDWNPYYCAARVRARRLFNGTSHARNQLRAVAQHSSEFQAIENVLSQLPPGASVEAFGTSPAVVLTEFPDNANH